MGYRIEYKSKNYKHVNKLICESSVNATKLWQGIVCGCNRQFGTEKEAAKWVDLKLISKGKEPVNILVRK
ncbi:MAG: hypothetical protein GY679_04025 [Mycoplasma sp.]|nr:hypothetical protein [Mycoplasma sp.]